VKSNSSKKGRVKSEYTKSRMKNRNKIKVDEKS
jgi:hypothetical protein